MTLKLVTHPSYSFPFPGKHRFPMEKFRLLHEHLQRLGIAQDHNVLRPGRARMDLLQLAHGTDYLNRFCSNQQTPKELREMGLPWSEGLLKRSLISPNGTFLTGTLALNDGIACHLAGGTHHAHYDRASGFCIINDLAVAALGLLHPSRRSALERPSILIFDCDVHQGDGTAAILKDEPRIFTCSVHCEKNFPIRKQKSDLDVDLPTGLEDDAYLDIVLKSFRQVIDQSKPALIFYDAGVDVYRDDPLGLLNISLEGIRQRDRMILQECKTRGIPVATVIGGGYDNDRQALAERHGIVVEEAAAVFY